MKFLSWIKNRVRRRGQVEHHVPLGLAIRSHWLTGQDAEIEVDRSDGVSYTIRSREFFSIEGRLEALDEQSLQEARGRVLDVGAGAGRHSLRLQEAGHEVVAVDISPLCVEVMHQRGVEQVRVADIFSLDAEEFGDFDTVLFLMQSIGIAGSGFGLERLLLSLAPRLRRGGQVLLDSSPLLGTRSDCGPSLEGIDVSFSYQGVAGEPFSWLYLDEKSLAEISESLGWKTQILARTATGEYLARLLPPEKETTHPGVG
ncbi:MAG: class I SAM-dependent methyltransferase [Myxococcota bacterium]|jgi:SAM-dependent methyltransferase|nr:class I SAM-dependent methyltransferase [Myxococcota bacterium]